MSRDGRGAIAHSVFISHQVTRISALGRTLLSYGVGVPIEQVSRHVVVTTDAFRMGWGCYVQ